MSDNFYRAFEERYRGPRDLIKTRLRIYLPFIEPLKACHADAATFDLGCGRGEWLELLQENGFQPKGVDLDDGMLAACRERDLPAEHEDAIAALKRLADTSQIVVSGFHIVEHMPFDLLHTLVQEALRVLKPGGLLILETPNPENLTVGTSSFYYDPTHLRPIPPPLLAFLPEYHGFKKIKTIRLQEAAHLLTEQSLVLLDVLAEVSPDYAIVAQKDADEDILSATSGAFEKEYGIGIEALASRYDKQAEIRMQQAEAKTEQAHSQANQAQARAEQANTQAQQAQARAEQANTQAQLADAQANRAQARAEQADAQAQHAGSKAQQAEAALNAIYASSSWRITAPLRWVVIKVRAVPTRSKFLIRLFIAHAKLYIQARPRLRNTTIALINRFPALKQRLKGMVLGSTPPPGSPDISLPAAVEFDNLTPQARQIYVALKAAIAKSREVR